MGDLQKQVNQLTAMTNTLKKLLKGWGPVFKGIEKEVLTACQSATLLIAIVDKMYPNAVEDQNQHPQ